MNKKEKKINIEGEELEKNYDEPTMNEENTQAEEDNETVALVTRRKDTNSVYFNTLHVDNISALAKYIKLLANL